MSGRYLDASLKENWIKEIRSDRCKINITISFVVFALVISCVAIGYAVNAHSSANNDQTSQSHLISRVIPSFPHSHSLDATATFLNMVLPNDLSDYKGKVYRIWATSAQPHVVQIASGGQNPQFYGLAMNNGDSKKATFGGAIGDGFVFEVIGADKITIISVNNVNFT